MDAQLQQQIAFFLTGRQSGPDLRPMDASCRPALLSRYQDLTSLRFDLPLVLNREGTGERAVLSLSRLVDDAIDALDRDPDRERIARHAYRLEHELRRKLSADGAGDLSTLWHTASIGLASKGDETILDSAKRLWAAFQVDGDLVDADEALPARVVRHAWASVQASKTLAFRQRAERLLLKLRGILESEAVSSEAGRQPERLRAGVGASFAATFDFAAMSRILVEAKPGIALSNERRSRIAGLIDVLERQRFFPMDDQSGHYGFLFERCTDALRAYQERHDEAVELVKTLAIAELEANGEYRESVHDRLFDGFGANGLNSSQLAELPNYLICAASSTLDAAEIAQMVELLAVGLPIKVLVQSDDVLEPSTIAEGHLALGFRARQLVDIAIGLTDVFVFQASAAHLFSKREAMMRGLSYDGPAIFSVFSGAGGHTGQIPPYLIAAAATESRAFPSLVYDPSAGPEWATRLSVNDNPQSERDWPIQTFVYEDEKLQARSETLAFTLADFMATDDRFFEHYAIVPPAAWSDDMVPANEGIQMDMNGMPSEVPYIALVDNDGHLQRAILDSRTLLENQRCLTMWHSLQELGGIHNSHAERALAKERDARTVAAEPPEPIAETMAATAPATAGGSAAVVESVTPEPIAEDHGDEPYIETARCTTCNECTNLNNRMFAYNAEKQAYIADPTAGTFRQLVEAAEGCQVSIIHPGKPRDPKEPGLDDLIRRAAEFN